MFRAMQTWPFKSMRTNLWPRNLTTGPRYLTLISHLGCINMCVLHTSTLPGGGVGWGGACMALVPHCDTNQGRWRTSLSCKHQSLLVLFKCLPSLILLSLTLASPCTPGFSRLSWPLPSLSSPSKSACREKREPPGAEAAPRQTSLLGVSLCLSAWGCFQAQPRPFHIQMLQSGLWPTGGSLWLRPQVAGSRWWFNSSGREKERGSRVI